MDTRLALITGGSGYFGELLCRTMLGRGYQVRILDLNPPAADIADRVEFIQGDIRTPDTVAKACDGVGVVHHNVAQVPLAKDIDQFWSVNRDGARILIEAAEKAGVGKLVYTSSSAIFGVPKENPVTRATPASPAEDYGRAKEAAERMCHDANTRGLDVSIVRPRTILGHGRLGVVQILFDWICKGADVPVFNGGKNVYQFVHADDLADACIAAGERPGLGVYNIGAAEYGTMRQLLEGVIAHAGSRSKIKSVPMGLAEAAMNIASALGLSPLGPYHSLMYGRSLYFDISDAVRELGYAPKYSNVSAIIDSYDWYMSNKDKIGGAGRSLHQSAVKKGAVALTPLFLGLLPT